ncbi:hypothetical protein HF086_014943 [Spodoptera exigua]|uniref:Uncharacterized protein n=1 Tax=Spodoptera exigua TaxID=7107 RepID=A0A922MJT0_SPOEX|nr:hypothetical protein HF086_014943 [Spodoptera exigua]
MNEKKLVQNFKSYINVSPLSKGEKNGSLQEVKPKLLNEQENDVLQTLDTYVNNGLLLSSGELVTGAAHSVVMLTPLSEWDRGRFGSLFITNYKLSFVPLENSTNDVSTYTRCLAFHGGMEQQFF